MAVLDLRLDRHRFAAGGRQTLAQDTTAAPAPVSGAPAQKDSPDDAANSDKDNTVVVITGSRVIANGNTAPTPVTVLTSDALATAAPTSIADGLAQVPQFRGSTRPGTFVTPQSSTGAFLNLRGLGTARTLVLLDGRRTPPTTSDGRTDINVYPQLLLKRVDTVTGGASAAYGSDAVSGVINFITDTTFVGVKGEVSGGISSRSDGRSRKASIAGGSAFAGGRGHIVGSVEYNKNDGILTSDNRAWDHVGVDIIPNPNYPNDGRPANLWRYGVTGALFTPGGLISSGPLKGTQFLPGGATSTFNYGTDVSGSTMVGGDGIFNNRGNIDTPIETLATFTHVAYDVTPDFKIWGEGAWSRSSSYFAGTMPNFSSTTGFTIYNDNAFLPSDVKSRMATAGVTSIPVGRISTDWGRTDAASRTKTYRVAAGFNLTLGGWKVDGSVDSGETVARLKSYHTVNQITLFNAVDSVISPVTGLPVCRSTLTFPGNGCVPLNIFGEGSASPEALDYILDDAYSTGTIKQTAASLSVRGQPFSTWAGPVSIGGGFDYRVTSAVQTSDALSQTVIPAAVGFKGLPGSLVGKLGAFLTGNQSQQPYHEINVKEVYAETLVPLALDQPWARSLDLNAAYRYADYSSSGGISSWKIGLAYVPVDSLRFRATQSRDVRAPSLNELYSPLTVSLGALKDPVTGNNNSTVQYFGGNPDLKPEVSDTTTAGVVFTPSFVPGFSISYDWYKIEVAGAIGTLGGLNVLNLCASGQTYYCQYVARLSDNTLVSVTLQNLNLNALANSGTDVEVNYHTRLDAFAKSAPGDISARLLVSNLAYYRTTDPFGTVVDTAGVNGGESLGLPHWQGSFSLTYHVGALSVFAQERYIGKGIYSQNYVEGGTGTNGIDYNRIPSITYTDINIKYDVNAANCKCQLYFNVNNLFDRDPPPSPSRIGSPVTIIATNPTLYDTIGRYFSAGIRFRF
ncbi:MAG: TonB-dependent receptor [Asticcacaulis sp.]